MDASDARQARPARVPAFAAPSLVLLLLAAVALLDDGERSGDASSDPRCETGELLRARGREYRESIEMARSWLDGLHVDPLALRARGIKGKKKLTEQLDGYYRLWQIAGPEERPGLRRRIAEVVAVTSESRYHDMAAINERQFKQDATSYLRAALLMERLGLDTTTYRDEIRRIQPRLDAHLARRGPHQRAVFHWYYRHFGLEEPFPMGDALGSGHIARRTDPSELSLLDVYQVTHEVFVPYEYGERLDVDPFSDEDKAYLRRALELVTARYIARGNVDVVAELISCMRYLRFVDSPIYRDGLVYLLERQNPDGSWGDLERSRQRYGPWGLHHVILHTTVVALDALSVAFHEPWNRRLFDGCEVSQAGAQRTPTTVFPFARFSSMAWCARGGSSKLHLGPRGISSCPRSTIET